LVAAVQRQAGARCHRAGNLLHAYYMSAEIYRSRSKARDKAGIASQGGYFWNVSDSSGNSSVRASIRPIFRDRAAFRVA
jgi:hypothetical protein